MKKSTKIILPALALLVLGTTAAATGTVAWFAANGVVSATGMQVQCDVSKNLLIANTDPSAFNSSTTENNYGASVSTLNVGIKTLSPSSTTPDNMAKDEFFYAAEKIGAVAGEIKDGARILPGTNADKDHPSGYYAKHEFWVANSAKDNLALSITGLTVTKNDGKTSLSNDISKALRVGFAYQDRSSEKASEAANVITTTPNVAKIFSVMDGATTTYEGLTKATTETGVVKMNGKKVTEVSGDEGSPVITSLSEEITISKYSPSVKLGNILSTPTATSSPDQYKWSRVFVYVWYEGQDEMCTANKALDVEEISISFELTANATTQTPSQGQGAGA